MENKETDKKKILKGCIKFGKTIRADIPTAIERYIKAREGEILEEKEKIKRARSQIEKIKEIKKLAQQVPVDFWIKEMDERKKLYENFR